MKHTFKAQIEYDNKEINLYYTHIKVPKKVFDLYKEKNVKRVIFHLNDQSPVHGGFIPKGDGTFFLITSKKLLKENNLSIGDEVEVTLYPDESKYGMPICEEMVELLEQDEIGNKLFHELTDGKIRSLLYKVNGYKSSDKRIEKGVIVLEHLKANAGKLDWKMLNEAFKIGLQI